ncbi:MAG: caspase family protein [Deltaproteobacteria bacterium]|nr:caspase family protein [Deltaproteobacteria bacterium]
MILIRPLALMVALALASAGQAATQRFALIAATNDGGPDRVRLRYANSDAESFGRVLGELGGVIDAHRIALLDVDRERLACALEELRRTLAQARATGDGVEVVFYYSGHADENGLLLGDERYEYRELRQELSALPAEVCIAVVDSCASGALTRGKGGQQKPPFLIDESTQIRGVAVLTSSTASEASQESDRIGASYFSHYLVTALRGAGDTNGDSRVTLAEAYQFTYQQTLARTEKSAIGAQHPSYDMQLAGTGDLVLTDLRSVSAELVLDDAIDGTVFVRDHRGQLTAELRKIAGRPISLGLAPGVYTVTLEAQGQLAAAQVALDDSTRTPLYKRDFVIFEGEQSVPRGPLAPRRGPQLAPIELALVPEWSTNLALDDPINFFSLTLLHGRTVNLFGLGLGLLAHRVEHALYGLQVGTATSIALGDLYGGQIAVGFNYAAAPRFALQMAAGANMARRSFNIGQLAIGSNLAHGSLHGAQIAAGFNLVEGDLNGAQIALAGANLACQTTRGLQLGLVNIGDHVVGTQVGLVNVADRIQGAQIGAVNISRDMDGIPFGPIGIVRSGMFRIDAWTDDVSLVSVALKYGSRHGYTLLNVGGQPLLEQIHWYAGGGLGARARLLPQLFLEADFTVNYIIRRHWGWRANLSPGPDMLQRARLSAGWQLLPNVAVVGGVSWNFLISYLLHGADMSWMPPSIKYTFHEEVDVVMWPGFFLGIEF